MDIQSILEYSLLQIGSYHLKLYSIVLVVVLCVVVRSLLWLFHKVVYKSRIETNTKYIVYRISKYLLLVLSIAVGLDILGVNVTVFLAGSAALLVGLGLGLQDLFRDFISGIILLLDGTIKVGDIIEVNDLVAKVLEVNIRTTTVLTRGDKHLILPNSQLTSKQLQNWTHSDAKARFYVRVGVSYAADVALVMRLIYQATSQQEKVLKTPKPFVRFDDFGESSLDFIVYFWSEEVFRIEQVKSEIRIELLKQFSKNQVNIPFPQRTLHLEKEVLLSLKK